MLSCLHVFAGTGMALTWHSFGLFVSPYRLCNRHLVVGSSVLSNIDRFMTFLTIAESDLRLSLIFLAHLCLVKPEVGRSGGNDMYGSLWRLGAEGRKGSLDISRSFSALTFFPDCFDQLV